MIIIFVFLFGCNDIKNEDVYISSVGPILEVNKHLISKEQAIENNNAFLYYITSELYNNGELKLRSNHKIDKLKTQFKSVIRIVNIENKNPKIKKSQEVPIYFINYFSELGEPAGYVVSIGDTRYKKNILAFNYEGSFSLFNSLDSDFWYDRIDGFLHNELNENHVEGKDFLTKADFPNPPGWEHTGTYSFTKTKWHANGSPYIDFTPYDGPTRSAAGCAAVAMGEIMAYHKWPRIGAYKKESSKNVWTTEITSYPLDSWNQIQIANPNVLSSIYKKHVSNLLAEIGYKLKMQYHTNVSYAYPNDAKPVFEQMGYKPNIKHLDYDIIPVYNQINNKKLPVFMYGYSDPSGWGGHAYVVDGAILVQRYGYFIHIKNGNGGNGDGYCFSNQFQYSDYNSTSYEYRYNCGIMIDIEPNYNNQGSTQIYQVP